VADASVWIVVATVLSTLNISKVKDENGQEITPEIAFDATIVGYVCIYEAASGPLALFFAHLFFGLLLASKPKPFKCLIAPRSEKANSLVTQATMTI
jgi:hypothetical protein